MKNTSVLSLLFLFLFPVVLYAEKNSPLVTIGYFRDQAENQTKPLSYISDDFGVNWEISLTETPDNKSAYILMDVACNANGRCVAAGYYTADATKPLTYISNDFGKNWCLPGTAECKNANLPPLPTPTTAFTLLKSIWCDKESSGTHCTIIGNYQNENDDTLPVAYVSNDLGNNWSEAIFFNLPSSGNFILNEVTCHANANCIAVGEYVMATNKVLTYVSKDFGKTWCLPGTAQCETSSMPAAPDNTSYVKIMSLSCDEQNNTSCIIAGYYFDEFYISRPLIYLSNNVGATWSEPILPSPISTTQESRLSDAVCLAKGQCLAIGGYFNSQTGSISPLSYISSDNGKNWCLSGSQECPDSVFPPLSDNLSVFFNAFSLTCDQSGTSCAAISSFYETDSGEFMQPLAYHSDNEGKTWKRIPITPPVVAPGPVYAEQSYLIGIAGN